jgi:hypothetical protein
MSAVGTGNVFAGTSRGAGSAAIATAGNDSNAPQASLLKTFMALSSLYGSSAELVVVDTDVASHALTAPGIMQRARRRKRVRTTLVNRLK